MGRLRSRGHRGSHNYSVTVDDFVALQEVGKVINPFWPRDKYRWCGARHRLHAYEKVVWQNGRMMNNQMTNYIMPTSVDLPPIRVFFEELGNVHARMAQKASENCPWMALRLQF